MYMRPSNYPLRTDVSSHHLAMFIRCQFGPGLPGGPLIKNRMEPLFDCLNFAQEKQTHNVLFPKYPEQKIRIECRCALEDAIENASGEAYSHRLVAEIPAPIFHQKTYQNYD